VNGIAGSGGVDWSLDASATSRSNQPISTHGAHHHDGERIVVELFYLDAHQLAHVCNQILWASCSRVGVLVAFLWRATEWTAWRLASSAARGLPVRDRRWPVYQPLAFFIGGSSSTPTHRRFSYEAGHPEWWDSQHGCLPSSSGLARKEAQN